MAKDFGDSLRSIKEEQHKLKRKKIRIRAFCNHRSENKGENKLITRDEETFECKRCGQIINGAMFFEDLNPNVDEEIITAIDKVTNTLEILKYWANPKKDSKTIEYYANLIMGLKELPAMIDAAKDFRNKEEKKRAKKNRFKKGFPGYVTNGASLSGLKKHRR